MMKGVTHTVHVGLSDRRHVSVGWDPTPLSSGRPGYDIEYPHSFDVSVRVLLAALPAIAALSRDGGTVVIDASGLPPECVYAGDQEAASQMFERFAVLIANSVHTLYGKQIDFRVVVQGLPRARGSRPPSTHKPPVLLFGGGSESLTALARLLRRSRPVLMRMEGPRWTGSNPEVDAHKAASDREIADMLGLELVSIRTDAYQTLIGFQDAWGEGTRGPLFFVSALLFAPLVVGVAGPLLGCSYGALHLGSENEHAGFHANYCLSPEFLSELAACVAPIASFNPDLLELGKAQIVRELWQSRPDLAALQHSCFNGRHERWCHRCEKCFRSYVLIVGAGGDPAAVELDGLRLLRNVPHYWRALARAVGTSSYHRQVYRGLFKDGLSSRPRLAATLFPALILGEAARQRAKMRERARAAGGS